MILNDARFLRARFAIILFASIVSLLRTPTARSEPQQNDDAALCDRFLQEAPPLWEDYHHRAKQLQGRYHFQHTNLYSNMKDDVASDMKMNASAKFMMVTRETSTKGQSDLQTIDAYGINPNYAFALRRKTDDPPWVVTELVDLRRSALPQMFERDFEGFERSTNLLVTLYGEPLATLVRKPEFRVVRCRMIPLDGEDLVEVVFDYIQKSRNPIQGGTLLLDPKRFWSWRSFDAKAKSGENAGTIKYKLIDFRESTENFPVPKLVVAEIEYVTQKEGNIKQAFRYEYDLSAPARLPANAEFTLSAFGLPEPPGAAWPEKSVPLYVWVGLAGAGCLALAAVFRALKKRAARAAPAT